MKKAFLFDMDGVLIDTENHWVKLEEDFLGKLIGKEINDKMGPTTGISIQNIYKKAVKLGHKGSLKDFLKAFDEKAQSIYRKAELTAGGTELIENLKQNNVLLGLVSASPLAWVEIYLERAGLKDIFDVVLSLHERPDLKHKPFPDGYKEALKTLDVSPEDTFILEDSNPGIQAGKRAGATVIALRENLVPGYKQENEAHFFVDKMTEVWDIVQTV